MTNTEALLRLARNAKAFAKAYTEVKTALMREGVPAQEASESARAAALMASVQKEDGGLP